MKGKEQNVSNIVFKVSPEEKERLRVMSFETRRTASEMLREWMTAGLDAYFNQDNDDI